MALNRFLIKDRSHASFGALIKKWARGQVEIPKKPKELEEQLLEAGIEASWPTGDHQITEVNIFQGVRERLDFRLPPADLLEESEAHIREHDYPLPRYYEDLFGVPTDFSDTDPIEFHNARVGDYTASNCA